VYDTVAVPALIPDTTPVAGPTAAIAVLLELHVPPPEFDNAVVPDTHTIGRPVFAPGNGLTIMFSDLAQPVGSV
jgi:hypothetical protein